MGLSGTNDVVLPSCTSGEMPRSSDQQPSQTQWATLNQVTQVCGIPGKVGRWEAICSSVSESLSNQFRLWVSHCIVSETYYVQILLFLFSCTPGQMPPSLAHWKKCLPLWNCLYISLCHSWDIYHGAFHCSLWIS